MRERLACTLAAILWAAGAAAQVPLQQAEARSHIASAFVTGADPRVLAERVTLGPVLRKRLGDEADSRKVYDALVDATSGRDVRVRALSFTETERFLSVPGVRAGGDPLFALQAEELVLVLQYASPQKSVTFIEQLSAAPARAAAAPKPAPPPAPPPAPAAAPVPAPAAAPAAAPKPAPVLKFEPPVRRAPSPPPSTPEPPTPAPSAKPAPSVTPSAAPQPSAAPMKPTGDCVIKPVMSDQDFVNCGATPRQPVLPR